MRLGFFISALAYSALIIFLSSLSNLPLPEMGFKLSDKLLHFIEYTIFAFLWARTFFCFDLSHPEPKAILILISCGIIFAALDEFHQYFVPNRQADWKDWAADTCGVFAGYVVASVWQKSLRKFCR